MNDFDTVVPDDHKGLRFSKSLEGDRYTLDIQATDAFDRAVVTAVFTAHAR